MNSPSTRVPLRHCLRLSTAFVLGSSVVRACSGEMEISYLFSTESELLTAPQGSFVDELARLTVIRDVAPRAVVMSPDEPSYRREVNPRPATLDQDIAELRRALEDRGDLAPEVTAIVDSYTEARVKLEGWIQRRDQHDALPELELPAGLPAEFALYFNGASAWHQRKVSEARRAWQAVLALPERERHHRSTWAAFMLGRLAADEADTAALLSPARALLETRQWFQRTRQLALDGFADSTGLAAASYGWEARALLHAENFVDAIDLYLLQHKTGDPTAIESLRRTAARAIEASPEKLEPLARHPNSRGVLTAYLLSRGRSLFSDNVYDSPSMADVATRWGAALARAEIKNDPHADRIAWVAYEGGLFELARQWAEIARPDSAIGEWIRAQLALRSGNLRDGEKHLRGALAAGGLNDEQRRRACGELARACLAQDHAADALTAWIEGEHWEDAGYVASRVLSVEELKDYVDAKPATPMRSLLALRLARNGQVDRAANYYSADLQPIFRGYVADVRLGFDVTQPAGERADAFWRAAVTMLEHGEELLGREVRAEYYPVLVEKRADAPVVKMREDARLTGGAFATTPDELARIESLPAAEKNFRHFRYRAAELAWWAAALLPNDSDETAEILSTAGGWLKARDPQAAQPFYQALVIRCGNTALGRAAAQRRWFPPTAN